MTARYEFFIKGPPRLTDPYHLEGVGLPNVYLLNGVEIENDPDYGQLVTISSLSDLHKAIGFSIAFKRGPLTGDEMRYLRKQMQLSQTTLARQLRVNHQTVANYEKGKTADTGPADLALRLLYLAHVTPDAELAWALREVVATAIENDDGKPSRLRKSLGGPWQVVEHRAY